MLRVYQFRHDRTFPSRHTAKLLGTSSTHAIAVKLKRPLPAGQDDENLHPTGMAGQRPPGRLSRRRYQADVCPMEHAPPRASRH